MDESGTLNLVKRSIRLWCTIVKAGISGCLEMLCLEIKDKYDYLELEVNKEGRVGKRQRKSMQRKQ